MFFLIFLEMEIKNNYGQAIYYYYKNFLRLMYSLLIFSSGLAIPINS